ncbi:B3 domain-containing protein REM16 [Abrus precatorius]|uniref:B3 domain-containing protein REM16 n=1 Tax=Abrus precatorius TaxID=3816 RepID=A0A8B8MHH1_ABRPR|nr:B3 domain-containing protein REM16 [Abrus precatorius]
MGSSNCNGCRSWVDDIYWTHFQFLHFVQFLRAGYDQGLALPKAFSDNLKKKLPENVFLKGPGGVVWNVGLTTRDDTLYFTHGWQQFVKDHALKENDFLVFKYNGESQFEVLIFDGGSFCEKAGSYFVRKCGHTEVTEQGGGCLENRRHSDNSQEEVNTPSNADVECASPDKSMHINGTEEPVVVPSQSPSEKILNAGVESACHEQFMANGVTKSESVPPKPTNKRIRNHVSAVKRIQTKRRGRPPKTSSSHERTLNLLAESEPVSVGSSGKSEIFTSNRRPVTENEIKNTLQLAQAACTNNSLLIVMRPTHVYKRFYLSLQLKWMAQLTPSGSQELILRMGMGEWLAKFTVHNCRNSGGLTRGWKQFALDNNLEEFDVCVFEPAGHMNNVLVLDVTIFRVVEEIVPVTAATSSGGKKGRKPVTKAYTQI